MVEDTELRCWAALPRRMTLFSDRRMNGNPTEDDGFLIFGRLSDEQDVSPAARYEQLQVAPSTAFRWRRRFLALPQSVKSRALIGIAEADETFLLRSNKGQHPTGR